MIQEVYIQNGWNMLSPCDLTRLSDMLFELEEIHDKDHEGYSVIALRTPIDKAWHWFNSLVGIGHGLLEEKARDTLVKTKQQFLRCLDEQHSLEATLHLPQDIRATSGLTGSEHALLRIGTHCLFLSTHRMLLDPVATVDGLQKLFERKIHSPLLDDSYLEKLERFTRRYAMITLAALLELPYPICCFSKVIQGEKLDSSDIKVLSKWVKAIEKRKSHISVHLLHTALTGVVEGMLLSLQGGERSLAKNVATLEWRLYFGLCDLLGEDDHVYLDWVKNTVYSGAHLLINQKQMVVGDEVLCPLPEGMHARLYKLPEDPTSLLFVGCNPAVLGIWQVNAELCAVGCLLVKVKETDRHLRYFVIEHLSMALIEMQWKTANRQIDQSDRPYVEKLVRFLSWLAVNADAAPRNLRPDYLFFLQQEGKVALRALMPFDSPGSEGYPAIEKFVWECAKGNRWVFSHLMRESTLNQHSRPVLIRDIAARKLLEEDENVTVQQMLSREKITDPQYKDQVEAMVQKLIAVRDESLFNLSVRLKSNSLQQQLKTGLSEALLAHQQQMGFSSWIDSHLLEPEGLQAFERAFIQANPALF